MKKNEAIRMNIEIIILKISFTDKWELIREYTYYYQVQAQINVCNVGYRDFVVWTTDDDLMIERIDLIRNSTNRWQNQQNTSSHTLYCQRSLESG